MGGPFPPLVFPGNVFPPEVFPGDAPVTGPPPGDILKLCGLVIQYTGGATAKIGVYGLITSTDAAEPSTKMQVERCSGASCSGFTLIGITDMVKYPDGSCPQDEFIDFGPLAVPGIFRYRARLQNDFGFGNYCNPFEIDTTINFTGACNDGSAGACGDPGTMLSETEVTSIVEQQIQKLHQSGVTIVTESAVRRVLETNARVIVEQQVARLHHTGLRIIYEYNLAGPIILSFEDTEMRLVDRFTLAVGTGGVDGGPGQICPPASPFEAGPCSPDLDLDCP